MAKGKYKEWLEPDKLLLLEGWARDGLTDEQIAKNIGINVATLYGWKNKYDNINNALKKGKEVVDIEVENALLKRAFGYEYEYEETTTEVKSDENGKYCLGLLCEDAEGKLFDENLFFSSINVDEIN